MVGLAGEGATFDGNGPMIRAGLGGGSQLVNFGKSTVSGDSSSVVGNANVAPLGTSPLYPSTQPTYNLTADCYKQALPNVNGPLAGPGPAPSSTTVPTPAALPDPATSAPASAGTAAVRTSDTSGGTASTRPLASVNPLNGGAR